MILNIIYIYVPSILTMFLRHTFVWSSRFKVNNEEKIYGITATNFNDFSPQQHT